MIHVPDVRAAVEWHMMVGFHFVESHEEEGEKTWAALSMGSTQLMLNAGGRVTDADRRDVDLYIYSEDVAEAYERLEGVVDVIAPINATFCGNREFIVRDPNGFWPIFDSSDLQIPRLQRLTGTPGGVGTTFPLQSAQGRARQDAPFVACSTKRTAGPSATPAA